MRFIPHSKTSSLRLSVLISLILLVFISPFGAGAADQTPGAALQKIRIAYSGLSGSQVPAWVAYEHGFFRKYGLDVQLVFLEGGSRAVNALISGEVAAAQVGGSAVLRSQFEGSDLVLIAGFLNTMDYQLIVARDITRPDQLKGKSVAVSRRGSSSDFATRFALDKYGLEPDKDVAFLQIGSQPARFAALEAGKIQGVMIAVPLTIKAKKMGFNMLADLNMLGLEYQHTGLAVAKELIRSRPELAENILRAFVEAIHFYKTHRKEALEILAKYLKTDDMEALEETYEAIGLTLLPKKPYPTLKGIEVMLKEMAEKEPKAKTAKAAQFVDLRFIKQLDSSGFIDLLYRQPPARTADKASGTVSAATTDKDILKTEPANVTAKTPDGAGKDGPAPDRERAIQADAPRTNSPDGKQGAANVSQAEKDLPPAAPEGQEYTIQAGDTLSKLSLRFYDTPLKWTKLFEANRQTLKNPHYIFIGQKIVIPPDDQAGA